MLRSMPARIVSTQSANRLGRKTAPSASKARTCSGETNFGMVPSIEQESYGAGSPARSQESPGVAQARPKPSAPICRTARFAIASGQNNGTKSRKPGDCYARLLDRRQPRASRRPEQVRLCLDQERAIAQPAGPAGTFGQG